MDKYRIDSHKLIYHVDRVAAWQRGEPVYPIYLEISPSGACNHRCGFCAKDFLGYRKRYLDTGMLKQRLSEMGQLGVRSVMYAGEGEPLLHPDIVEIVRHTRASGIDVAFTTNGVLFDAATAAAILPHSEWIKISINAGTAATYAKIHGCRPDDFDKVLANMSAAARLRQQHGYRCALGMQMLLLPENWDEACDLAAAARDAGMDYLVIKPYSHHPDSETRRYENISYAGHQALAARLETYRSETFQVVFRAATMQNWDDGGRAYDCCLALPFWAYLDAGGDLWGCSTYLEDDRFRYGNLNQASFAQVWNGERRAAAQQLVESGFDMEHCRTNCRMDKINRYLWELRHPPAHVNFI